jgi:two-component sensor histidine kinase
VSEFVDPETRETVGLAPPALFAQVFEASPAPMVLLAADPPRFTIVASNTAHATALRRPPEALHGRGLLDVIPVRDEDGGQGLIEAVRASLQRALDTGEPAEMPPQPRAWEGLLGEAEARYWRATHTPLFGANGRITHILGTVRDVTAEVVEERVSVARALVMREIDHRARNALAVVQSIVRTTEAEDPKAFKLAVQQRVAALARAQTTLARRKWKGACVREVAESELAALATPGAYALDGPDIVLPAAQVQAISMILHELATNARKYGALSASGGTVSVMWAVEDERLRVTWTESDGPPAAAPESAGFGSRLIARLVRQLGGEFTCDWRPEGLRVAFTAPL